LDIADYIVAPAPIIHKPSQISPETYVRSFAAVKFYKAAPALAKIPDFKTFKHYQKACDLLSTMMKMRCDKACKSGGGSAQCPIKKCAKKKVLKAVGNVMILSPARS